MKRVETWPEEDVARLLHLWRDKGMSASQIGKVMGRTRNAIIGKTNRLKVPSPKVQKVIPSSKTIVMRSLIMTPKKKTNVAPEKRRKYTKRPPVPEQQPTIGVMFSQAKASHCQWPIEGTGAFMKICGCKPSQGKSYCPYHRWVSMYGEPTSSSPEPVDA